MQPLALNFFRQAYYTRSCAKGENMKQESLSVRDLTHIAIVAAIYVALTVTPPLNAISYGAYQFRISEMMNFMAFYNRKYIMGVTIGCMIANLYSFGIIDVFVGGWSTLVFLSLGVYLFSRYKNQYLIKDLLRLDHFYFAIFFSISMVTIAAELHFLQGLPFFLTWFTTAIGEFASLIVGAILINQIAKRIDLTK